MVLLRNNEIYLFGEIEGDIDPPCLTNALSEIEGPVTVHIDSIGGDVGAGLTMYNLLLAHPAEVTTIVEGFACSAASVVFMGGTRRLMRDASMLMIHNAWVSTAGNADQLRDVATQLDAIGQSVAAAYLAHVNIDADALQLLLDAESWILPEDAVAMGFATAVAPMAKSNRAAASAMQSIIAKLTAATHPPDNDPESDPVPLASNEPVRAGIWFVDKIKTP